MGPAARSSLGARAPWAFRGVLAVALSSSAALAQAPSPTPAGGATVGPMEAVPAAPVPGQTASAPTAASSNPNAVSTGALPEPNAQAIAAYDRAIEAYARGDKVSALQNMEESYRLSRLSDLLYNVAKLKRELNECRESLTDYRQYVREAPAGKYVGDANQAIQSLTPYCGDEPKPLAAGAPVPTTEAEPPRDRGPERRYWTAPRVVGWSLIGAGVAAGAATIGFAIAAHASANDRGNLVSTMISNGSTWNAQDTSRLDTDVAGTKRDNTWTAVFGVGTGALLASGIACLFFFPKEREGAPPAVSLAVQPGSAYASYLREF